MAKTESEKFLVKIEKKKIAGGLLLILGILSLESPLLAIAALGSGFYLLTRRKKASLN